MLNVGVVSMLIIAAAMIAKFHRTSTVKVQNMIPHMVLGRAASILYVGLFLPVNLNTIFCSFLKVPSAGSLSKCKRGSIHIDWYVRSAVAEYVQICFDILRTSGPKRRHRSLFWRVIGKQNQWSPEQVMYFFCMYV